MDQLRADSNLLGWVWSEVGCGSGQVLLTCDKELSAPVTWLFAISQQTRLFSEKIYKCKILFHSIFILFQTRMRNLRRYKNRFYIC